MNAAALRPPGFHLFLGAVLYDGGATQLGRGASHRTQEARRRRHREQSAPQCRGDIANASDAIVAAHNALRCQGLCHGPGRIKQGGDLVPGLQGVPCISDFVGRHRRTLQHDVMRRRRRQRRQPHRRTGEIFDVSRRDGSVGRGRKSLFAVDDDPQAGRSALAAGDVFDGSVAGRSIKARGQTHGGITGRGAELAGGVDEGHGEVFGPDTVRSEAPRRGRRGGRRRGLGRAHPVPPMVMPSMRTVGSPTPTGTLCPSLPQV